MISELRVNTRGLDHQLARVIDELVAKINEIVKALNALG
jgi:hypothetical protein